MRRLRPASAPRAASTRNAAPGGREEGGLSVAARTAPARLAPPAGARGGGGAKVGRGGRRHLELWPARGGAAARGPVPAEASPRPAPGAVERPLAPPRCRLRGRGGGPALRSLPAASTQPPPPPALWSGNSPPREGGETTTAPPATSATAGWEQAAGDSQRPFETASRTPRQPCIIQLCITTLGKHRRKALREQSKSSFITNCSVLLKTSRSTLLPTTAGNWKMLLWAKRTSASCHRLLPVLSWHW